MKITPLILAFCLATVAISQTDKKTDSAPQAPVKIGDKASAKWSSTTIAGATNEDQKAWLAKGKPETVTGELVDVSCYMQLHKTGEKHIDCGSKCVRHNQPAGILTKANELYVVMPEEHDPRRDGQVDIRETMASNMGKQVTASGMVQETKEGKALYISALDLKK
jgi:hypothetical protein